MKHSILLAFLAAAAVAPAVSGHARLTRMDPSTGNLMRANGTEPQYKSPSVRGAAHVVPSRKLAVVQGMKSANVASATISSGGKVTAERRKRSAVSSFWVGLTAGLIFIALMTGAVVGGVCAVYPMLESESAPKVYTGYGVH
eukprot:gnl/TRDRNA2_/TRDRNA2_124929_c0_seq1.p2 gnl/TRDRNA2_/TRDRNA2_124929_c0~~gnl/TRDRNA2_/TRDRNA2_124929_c0_seq1.p2  ORF type:complete len:142 (-),score=19.89 gnl/TRDRNA2_/TRDRNA2_124929_c0_seq1:165-590(-)